jgi:hypothetical protein
MRSKVRRLNHSLNIEKLASDNSWQLRHIDPFLNKIIETEKITIRKKTAKLLVFEYRSNRQKILQRTMITRNGEFLYIIECKSPARSFYRNEKIFNIAMSSFSYISGKEEPQNGESAGEQSIDTGKSIEQLEKSAGGDKRKSNGDEKFFEPNCGSGLADACFR